MFLEVSLFIEKFVFGQPLLIFILTPHQSNQNPTFNIILSPFSVPKGRDLEMSLILECCHCFLKFTPLIPLS